jgi:hypothetical protein
MHFDKNRELLRKTLSNFRRTVAAIAQIARAKIQKLLSIKLRRDEKRAPRRHFGDGRRRCFGTSRPPRSRPSLTAVAPL